MRKVSSILVPTDFSDHAEHALLYAASLGERFGTTLHLLHVVTLHGLENDTKEAFPDMTQLLKRADQVARERLDAGAATDGSGEVSVIKSLTRAINAPEAIVDYANRKSIDLIVISTRGLTGLHNVLLGSVTERVVRFAPCPVLVVERGDRDFVAPDSGAVTIKRVVVADNFSHVADQALRKAIGFLSPYKPEVHLVHAIETAVPPVYALAGVESVAQLYPDLTERLGATLAERAEAAVPASWTSSCVVREGKPHKVVSKYAREVEADLLVVAAETQIELSERPLGGTTERIVRHAPCPALVI